MNQGMVVLARLSLLRVLIGATVWACLAAFMIKMAISDGVLTLDLSTAGGDAIRFGIDMSPRRSVGTLISISAGLFLVALHLPPIFRILLGDSAGLFIMDNRLIFNSRIYGYQASLDEIESITLPRQGSFWDWLGRFDVNVRNGRRIPAGDLFYSTPRAEIVARLAAMGFPVIKLDGREDMPPIE
jgi:hypothetical protein